MPLNIGALLLKIFNPNIMLFSLASELMADKLGAIITAQYRWFTNWLSVLMIRTAGGEKLASITRPSLDSHQ